MSDDTFAGWRKSSYSGDGNSCVELATRPQSGHTSTSGHHALSPIVGVRDSKRNGRGPILEFSASAWREFLTQVKSA